MSAFLKLAFGAALVFGALAVPAARAQDEDLFSFIPPGGRALLGELITSGKVKAHDVLGVQRTRDEWLAYIRGIGADLDDVQQETLAAYLASNMPAASSGANMVDTGGQPLPRDGRDIALEFCQSCHIITVVVTQDRTREAWLGTMNKPSHVEINTTQKEREALADYLSLNAAIPIEEVPETLRAGGATY